MTGRSQLALILAMLFAQGLGHAEVRDGVSPQAISLPTGPGSIEGLGESFEPHLATGTGRYAVPFVVPPGRAGLAPSLGLAYDGGVGNGIVGMGWSLSGLDFVSRQSDKGLPEYGDAYDVADPEASFQTTDTFVTASGEELVRLSDHSYRAENESEFRSYRFAPDQDVWTARTRSGVTLTFGLVDAAACPGQAPRIESYGRTLRWMLTRAEDPNGNRIDYCYELQAGSVAGVYLTQVAYTRHASQVLAGEHRVVLTYGSRPDPVRDYRPGFELRWSHRLTRVDVCTRGGSFAAESSCPADHGARVRAYLISYEDEGGSSCPGCTVAYAPSRIASVTQVGADNATSLPTTSFAYTNVDLATTPNWSQLIDFPADEALAGQAAIVDMNADGLPDLVNSPASESQNFYVWTNPGPDGGGSITFPLSGTLFLGPDRLLGAPGTRVADLDGDGFADLLSGDPTDGELEIFRGNGRGTFADSPETFDVPHFDDFCGETGLDDPSLELLDLDFDKRIDVARTIAAGFGEDAELLIRLNRPAAGGGAELAPSEECASVEEIDFAEGRTQLADMNGDRLLDIVLLEDLGGGDLGVSYFPASGFGRFGSGRDDQAACSDPQGDDLSVAGDAVEVPASWNNNILWQRIFWEDVTSDGLADLLLLSHDSIEAWANDDGEELVHLTTLPGYPGGIQLDLTNPNPNQNDIVQFADVNGNGTRDLLIIDRDQEEAHYLDFVGTSGQPAHLLTEVDNGLGRRIEIDYRSSTQMAGEAAANGQAWKSPLPMAVNVVSKVTTRVAGAPGISGTDPWNDGIVTDYRYREGYYDGLEREFRGFAEMVVIQRGDVTQPTLLTRNHFHTGAPDGIDNDQDGSADEFLPGAGAEAEPLKGRLLESRTETCVDGNEGQCLTTGDIFRHDLQLWEIQVLHATGDCNQSHSEPVACDNEGAREVRFASKLKQRQAIVEAGAGPRADLLHTYVYDDFGNRVQEKHYGRVTAADPPPFGCLLASGVCSLSGTVCGAASSCPLAQYETCDRQSVSDQLVCPADPNATIAAAFPDPSADLPGDERFVDRCFEANETAWIVDRLCEESVLDGSGVLEAKRCMSYDGVAVACDASPTSCQQSQSCGVSVGNRTTEADWLLDPNPNDQRLIERVSSSFDSFGNVVAEQDARGSQRSLSFDALFATYPISETIHLGNDLEMSVAYHEGFGAIEEIRSWSEVGQPAGPLYQYQYDTLGRPVAGIEPGDSLAKPTMLYEYHLNDADDGISWITTRKRENLGGGTIDEHTYTDGLGRSLGRKQEGVTSIEWIFAEATAFNRRGEAQTAWLPYATTGQSYTAPDALEPKVRSDRDALGRETLLHNPDSSTRLNSYAPLSIDRHDENDTDGTTAGAFATEERDGLERLVALKERNAGETYVTQYEYDARGNLVETVDAQNNRALQSFDSLSRLTFRNDPDRGHQSFVYDDADNLTQRADAKGQLVAMSYDAANRVLSEDDVSSPGIDVEYFYDRPPQGGVELGDGTTQEAGYTAGQLAYVQDLSGEEHISYDARRRIEWQLKLVMDPRHGYERRYTTRFTYDSANRVSRITYPDGDRARFVYNKRGLLKSVRGYTGPRMVVNSVLYQPSGQIQSVVLGNGTRTDYGYDQRLRMTSLHTQGAGSSQGRDLLDYEYFFDGASNLVGIDDLRSDFLPGDPRHNTQRFEYDDLHRLEEYRLTSPSNPTLDLGAIAYGYDRIGNMLWKTSGLQHDVAGKSVTHLGDFIYGGGEWSRNGRNPGDPPGPHAVTSTDQRVYAYDDNGNVVDLDGTTATWDYKDRLASIDNGTHRTEYVYDHANRRTSKRVIALDGSGEVQTLYPSRFFEVRGASQQPTKFVFAGESRVAEIRGTLDPNAQRVQHFALDAGWNLLSLAVQSGTAASQLGIGSQPEIADAFRWDSESSSYVTLGATTAIPRGSVVWIRAAAPLGVSVKGSYGGELDATLEPDHADSGFLPTPGLAQIGLDGAVPSEASAWTFDVAAQAWQAQLASPPPGSSQLPSTLGAGEAIWVSGLRGVDLDAVSDAEIRYFHADHLGSVNLISDDGGAVFEEIHHYAYGYPRVRTQEATHGLASANYGFGQKEFDEESGLHYFEARYLASVLGRFVSVDPLCGQVAGHAFETRSQRLNCYAYASNNPLTRIDPTGLVDREMLSDGLWDLALGVGGAVILYGLAAAQIATGVGAPSGTATAVFATKLLVTTFALTGTVVVAGGGLTKSIVSLTLENDSARANHAHAGINEGLRMGQVALLNPSATAGFATERIALSLGASEQDAKAFGFGVSLGVSIFQLRGHSSASTFENVHSGIDIGRSVYDFAKESRSDGGATQETGPDYRDGLQVDWQSLELDFGAEDDL